MGLVQRAIESAGFSTVVLSNIPELTAAVGVPRLVGVEYPFGQIMGKPGSVADQHAVLRGALEAVVVMDRPGSLMSLPFKWHGAGPDSRFHPPVPPPIAGYLKRHPWHLPKLFSRQVP